MVEANTEECTLYLIGHCLTCEQRDECEKLYIFNFFTKN
jgi:hypothetical protein